MIAPFVYCATIIWATVSEPLSYWDMMVNGEYIIKVTCEVPVYKVDLRMVDLSGKVGTAGWTPEVVYVPTETPTPPPLMYEDDYGVWYGLAPGWLPAVTYAVSYLPWCATPASVRYYGDEDSRWSRTWTRWYPFDVVFDARGLEGPVEFGNQFTCNEGSRWNLRSFITEFYNPANATPTYGFTQIPTEEVTATWTPRLSDTPTRQCTPTSTEASLPSFTPGSPTGVSSATPSGTPKPTWTPMVIRMRVRGSEYRDGWLELLLEPRGVGK